MELTNKEIFDSAEKIIKAFEKEERYFPAKINFLIQKNKQVLTDNIKEIEQVRFDILKKYATINGEEYKISNEDMEIVNKELIELFEIKQDIDLLPIPLSCLNSIELTPQQMEALLFIIDDDEEENDD